MEKRGRTPSRYGAPPLTMMPPLLAPTRSPPRRWHGCGGSWDFLPDALNGTLSRVLAAEVGVASLGFWRYAPCSSCAPSRSACCGGPLLAALA